MKRKILEAKGGTGGEEGEWGRFFLGCSGDQNERHLEMQHGVRYLTA